MVRPLTKKLVHNLHDENSKRVHIVINMHIQRTFAGHLRLWHLPSSFMDQQKIQLLHKDFNRSGGAA